MCVVDKAGIDPGVPWVEAFSYRFLIILSCKDHMQQTGQHQFITSNQPPATGRSFLSKSFFRGKKAVLVSPFAPLVLEVLERCLRYIERSI